MVEVTPLSDVEQFRGEIFKLEKSLREASPEYEILLQKIHRNLQQDEAMVHLLSEEEIGVIVLGLMKRKNVVLVKEKEKKVGKKTKMGIGDLM